MDRLRELVRLHRKGTAVREVTRLLQMSPNTERSWRNTLDKAGLLRGDVNELPELEVLRVTVGRERGKPPIQERSSVEKWRAEIEKQQKKGVGPTAIHQVLCEENIDFEGSVSAVKRLYASILRGRGPRAEDVAIPVVTAAGQVAQVDFGYVGKLLDPLTGRRRKAWVFVVVLGCSRHMFAKVVFDQSTSTWLQLHREAFEHFGGVPAVVVPDNLKAAVIRAAFAVDDLSVLNRAYRELARHYDFIIDPAPPRAPEKKGKVESGVKYVKGSFFKPREFVDIVDANKRLHSWVMGVAGARRHGTTSRKPLEVFHDIERSELKSLPSHAWTDVEWRELKVGRNTHVGFDARFWSVPWPNIGAQVLVRATPTSVEIYRDDSRIATHSRSGVELWSTKDEHLPEGRKDLRHRDRRYWEERADVLGEEVGAYIREVLDADSVQQPLRRVAAILRALETVPAERARAAAVRASYFGMLKAAGVKRILREGLDLQPLPTGAMSPGWAKQPAFARSATAFLKGMEVRDGTC